MSEVTIVTSAEGDWVGVYKGSRLIYQGHDIVPSTLLELLNIPHDEIHNWNEDQAESDLPDNLENLHRPGE